MSKLVEIKAELLKWANNRIKVLFMDSEVFHKTISDDGSIYGSMYGGGSVCVSPQNTVKVNPKEYEQAVINRIKEMIDNSEGNKMKITKSAGVISLWALPIISGDWFIMVRINCDPRPHEETYTINLQEEDNE